MEKKNRMRRTMLFCPAINPKLYIDSVLFNPDCIIFDLEDAIKYSQKVEARDLLCEALKSLDFNGVEVFVRINPLYTEFGEDDVRELVKAGLRKMRLPMCETKEDVIALSNLLSEVEKANNIEEGSCKIQCSLETPIGVNNALEIAKSSERVTSISFGAEDYTRVLGIDRTKDGSELFLARSTVVNAASIAGVDAIDTVWADFNDVDGFRKEAEFARQIGFAGKSCIHPSQIEVVHDIYTPSLDEVEQSQLILAEVEKAGIEAGGVIQVNGKMIDIPVIDKARRVVSLAKAAGIVK